MKFGVLIEQAARADWAANYVNYKRAKDKIKDRVDVPTFKGFIAEECSKVERFYQTKFEEIEQESEQLTVMMSQKSSQVAGLVKRSWNHTEDVRGLYDFGRLNYEGIRKSLKKYDKVMKTKDQVLQKVYFEELKKQYTFFNFRTDEKVKVLLEKCAAFWNQDDAVSKLKGASITEIKELLPDSFPLVDQIADQNKTQLEPLTEEDDEDDDDEKVERQEVDEHGPQEGTDEENDSHFERDFQRQRNKKPEWKKMLADYQLLNNVLKQLASVAGGKLATPMVASLTMSDHPEAAYGASPEIIYEGKAFKEVDWFRMVDKEMEFVSKVTNAEIMRVRSGLATLRDRCEQWSKEMKDKSAEQSGARARTMLTQLGGLEAEAKQLGSDFLALEKFVNLNYQAFEKLLKNHDRLMPHTPCHQFYMSKLRNQDWIRNDFSDVFVALSDCHSLLRQDDSGVANNDAKQDFVRNTKKYWVPTEHVSSLKHLILQHLPVFRVWTGGGDSQLINSVYFDNRQMQLYHGRMDKTPGAIALRLRWYGTEIKSVFVERKTHLDAWTGNVSVKERFVLDEPLVVPFLNGSYTVNEFADDMKRKGKKDSDIQEACKLFSQIARVIESKQLGPTVRTQYMRTAFQIPFDATVRISLDTNLAMVREDCCGYASTITERWRRDERIPVKASEHTHFPHAILEVKLQGDVENPPRWVKDLLESGMVTEVYKFSKFIHGSAVLLTELVAAAPYWIDDVSIRDSVNASAPSAANKARTTKIGTLGGAQASRKKDDDESSSITFSDGQSKSQGRVRALSREVPEEETHPLLGQMRPSMGQKGGRPGTDFLGRHVSRGGGADQQDQDMCSCCGLASSQKTLPRKVPVRIEPKTYFANERTFLSWMHMSVTLGSISSALTVFSEEDTAHGAAIQIMSLFLTLVATFFVASAAYTFWIRRGAIRKREDTGLDQVAMPVFVASTLVFSLMGVLITNLSEASAKPSPQ